MFDVFYKCSEYVGLGPRVSTLSHLSKEYCSDALDDLQYDAEWQSSSLLYMTSVKVCITSIVWNHSFGQ